MKQFNFVFSVLLRFSVLVAFVLSESAAAAANSDEKPSRQAKPAKPGQLSTSFRFGADSLHGKYQNSANTTATVENDKYLDDLLSAPKNFKARAQQEAQRD